MGTTKTISAEAHANWATKDSVFCDLFSDKRYLLRLYRDLHPEDEAVSQDDLDIVTLDRVLTRGQYNDLGFVARDRFMILVEAQSTWSPNIVVRMLFYLIDTYRRRVANAGMGALYSKTSLNLPVPEFYVVYTGEGEVPDTLSFANEIVHDTDSAVEARVKVLQGVEATGQRKGILDEYVEFAHVFDEKRLKLGPTLGAVEEAIDACIERGVLREYLETRREEVVAMMAELLDREAAMAAYREEIEEEAKRAGLAIGLKRGIEQGIERGIEQGIEKGIEQGIEQGIEKNRIESIKNLMSNLSLSAEDAMDALGISVQDRERLNRLLEHD